MIKHIIIFFLLGTLFFSCKSNQEKTDSQTVEMSTTSEQMPLKIYESFSALEPRLQTQSDTTYIVNFWATWCKPCVAELPHFMDLADTYKNQKIKLLYVSLDFKKQIDSKLRPFLEAGKLKGEVVVITDHDFNAWIDKVSPSWQGSIPATLIFNKDKREFFEESFTYKELEKELTKYLK
jgi:thiol-disulfide isomerase/thioredoxin